MAREREIVNGPVNQREVQSGDSPTTPPQDTSSMGLPANHGKITANRGESTIEISFASFSQEIPPAYGEIGPYQLLEKIGEGGMGTVYKARHSKLDRLMAVKLLSPKLLQNRSVIMRFEREMAAVGKLLHPNVVQANDAGEVSGTHYLAMEYLEGCDLQTRLAQNGPLSVLEACRAIHQAAQGLEAAHALGLVHRDIKPGNLFLTKSGQVKILDLGLALVTAHAETSTLTSMDTCFGTPDYMAPEQWEDTHAVDGRADLYALGCTLYSLLTGKAPFDTPATGTAAAKMKAHVIATIPDLRAACPAAPQELAALYERLMAKKPEQRLGSAKELVESLGKIMQQTNAGENASISPPIEQTIRFSPITLTVKKRPARKRKRTWLSAAGSIITIVLLGISIFIVNRASHNPTHRSKSSGSIDEPAIDFAAERKAAEVLLPYADLTLVAANQQQKIHMDGVMPSERFVVTEIDFRRPLPPGFTEQASLPSLQSLHSLKIIKDLQNNIQVSGGSSLVVLQHLSESPASQTLENISIFLTADSKVTATLNRFKALREIRFAYCSDELIFNIGELNKLNKTVEHINFYKLDEFLTESGAKSLSRLPLREISLDHLPSFKTPFFQALSESETLESLNFTFGLTDQVVSEMAPLAASSSLQTILFNSSVDTSGIALQRLSDTLPRCRIEWGEVIFLPKSESLAQDSRFQASQPQAIRAQENQVQRNQSQERPLQANQVQDMPSQKAKLNNSE